MSNEVRRKELRHVVYAAAYNDESADFDRAFDEALRTERRMVVDEIRERIGPMGPSYDEPWNRIAALLDEIGSAR